MTTRSALPSRNLALPALGILALAAAVFFLIRAVPRQTYTLQLGTADILSRNHSVALALAQAAAKHGLRIAVVSTAGSVEELAKVNDHTFDIALIQGGLIQDDRSPDPHVRQVASLATESLHLLVRPELLAQGLPGLRGHRLNLGAQGSGTRALAQEVLDFASRTHGADYIDEHYDYTQLESMPKDKLPDGIFVTSLLPAPIADYLINQCGYRLMEVPLKEALSLRVYGLEAAEIPAFTYGVTPPVPPRTVRTVGTHMLLVANDQTPHEAVTRLLETLYSGEFAREAKLPPSQTEALTSDVEFPMHPGTLAYLKRDDPPITSNTVSLLENLRSFLASMAVGSFLLWRWYERRRSLTFEKYLHEVTHLEREALRVELEPVLDLKALLEIRQHVSRIKSEALEKYASGEIKGNELMMGFLAHVTDVRAYLSGLILYQRDRLEEQARLDSQDPGDAARFQEGWQEALGDFGLPDDPAERQGSD